MKVQCKKEVTSSTQHNNLKLPRVKSRNLSFYGLFPVTIKVESRRKSSSNSSLLGLLPCWLAQQLQTSLAFQACKAAASAAAARSSQGYNTEKSKKEEEAKMYKSQTVAKKKMEISNV